jgi:hypothetical protein
MKKEAVDAEQLQKRLEFINPSINSNSTGVAPVQQGKFKTPIRSRILRTKKPIVVSTSRKALSPRNIENSEGDDVESDCFTDEEN